MNGTRDGFFDDFNGIRYEEVDYIIVQDSTSTTTKATLPYWPTEGRDSLVSILIIGTYQDECTDG
jgi:hypothetical protein